MKLETNRNEYHTGGNIAEISFRVANTPHMMEILSGNIYSNKIMAVIRELSTNAFESHMKANQDKRYYVQLPTSNDPIFRIRDYGTGLSLDQFKELYTTYGSSDKGDSNIFTGCLGLGSKSPFAYIDTFITISYFHGKKYSIVNTKDESGVPTCNVMDVEDTDEPNGLEIYFDVKSHDISSFKNEAIKLYKFFEDKYRPETNIELDYPIETYELEGKNWKIRQGYSYAVMGQVAYPIQANAIDGAYTACYNALNAGLILYFDIGEICMAASREQLEYNDKTKTAIKARIDEIYAAVKKHIETFLDKSPNIFEAAVNLDKYEAGILHKFYQANNLKYKGTIIPKSIDISKFNVVNRHFSNHRVRRPKSCHKMIIHKGTKVYYEDQKGTISNCEWECSKNGGDFYILRTCEDKIKEDFIKHIGIDNIENASSLPKKPRESYSRGTYTGTYELEQTSYRYNSRASYWKQVKVDCDNETGVYILIDRFAFNEKDGYTLCQINRNLESLKIPTETVIGVLKSKQKKFFASDNWTEYSEWLKTQVEPLITEEYAFYHRNKSFFSVLKYDKIWNKLFSKLSEIDESSIIHEIAEMVEDNKVKPEYGIIDSLINTLKDCFDITIKIPKADEIPSYKTDYPLLQYLENCSVKEVINYINMVEGVKYESAV